MAEAPSRIQYGIACDQRNGKHDQLKIFERLSCFILLAKPGLPKQPRRPSTYQSGETVIVDGSKTDRLLILKKGNVAIVKEDTEIAKVAEPGAAFVQASCCRRSAMHVTPLSVAATRPTALRLSIRF